MPYMKTLLLLLTVLFYSCSSTIYPASTGNYYHLMEIPDSAETKELYLKYYQTKRPTEQPNSQGVSIIKDLLRLM